MSDETVAEETIEQPTVEEVADAPQGEQDSTDWKAEARKWEKRAKDANGDREAAQKWRDYEESLKPEQERVAQRLAEAEFEAESARAALLRYEIAAEKNIPSDAIRLLNGSTREEIEEAADALVTLLQNQSKPITPIPDLSQGRPTVDKTGQLSREDLKHMTSDEINRARLEGRLDHVMGK